jgi:hypothetical protein
MEWMKKRSLTLLWALLLYHLSFAQTDTLTVLYYNILNYPGGSPGREAYFRTISRYTGADLIVINELLSDAGAVSLLQNALNVFGTSSWQKAAFTDGPDTDNMLFYDSDKLVLKSQGIITTDLRHINEYILYYRIPGQAITGDTIFFYIYSAHLKAGTTVSDEDQRLAEVRAFRQRIDNIAEAENILFGGDMNFYSGSEAAYDTLVNYGVYPMSDVLPAGNWHDNQSFAAVHTQSTRTAEFGGGATGGLDDRFDFTFFSGDLLTGLDGATLIPGSCNALGNDGNHFNIALIDPPAITVVPDSVVQALYYMSDHLPVVSRLKIESTATVPAGLVISEIMQNPYAVADAAGEWFEVYNASDAGIDLNGFTIKDNGSDSHTISGSVVVPAHGFAVLGINADPLSNGGYQCQYQYANFFLGNADDEIILIGNDGVTEIDRVEYDGGPGWPDPNGASMVYTGTAAENNNDPAGWTTAILREPTYTGTTGDLGSPGTNGVLQNLFVPGLELDLKVFLEGPFNGSGMATGLQAQLPLAQPYNIPPWNYSGSESVGSIPASDIVDWVLVEIRDAASPAAATPATTAGRQAAFLHSDGSVTAIDGTSNLSFSGNIQNGLFAVVWHRNHLAIMSATAIAPSGNLYTYDFTDAGDKVYGGINGHKSLAAGIWGMPGGDGNATGQVDNLDKNDVWKVQAGTSGYKAGDFNLDSQVSNSDKNDIWNPNSGRSSQVPD